MQKLRIQIVNYNTRKYLDECLQTLANDLCNFSHEYSVAILDNNSEDDLTDIPERFPDLHNIEVHHGTENVGYGAGHNHLYREDVAEFVLLLNPDVKCIEKNTVERLLEAARIHRAAVVGPRLVTETGEIQRWDHGELQGFVATVALHAGASYWRQRTTPLSVAWTSEAVFLIRSDWYTKTRGFDERFFLYKEEEDLCWRIREQGGMVVYDPTISVFHYGGVVADKSKYIHTSSALFCKKHIHRCLYWPLTVLHNTMQRVLKFRERRSQ